MCEAYNLSSPWSERRSLTLCIPVILWDNAGIASLLHSSPYLENLEIRLSYCSDMVKFLYLLFCLHLYTSMFYYS